MRYRIIVTVTENGFAASSAYPPLPGEDWERGSDITDGKIDDLPRLGEMLKWLTENPAKTPDDWKQTMRTRRLAN